jgi:hypothetical protein
VFDGWGFLERNRKFYQPALAGSQKLSKAGIKAELRRFFFHERMITPPPGLIRR